MLAQSQSRAKTSISSLSNGSPDTARADLDLDLNGSRSVIWEQHTFSGSSHRKRLRVSQLSIKLRWIPDRKRARYDFGQLPFWLRVVVLVAAVCIIGGASLLT